MTLTSPVDMPGCIIDTEPVSKIRRLVIPSISTEIVGAPDSNRTETENLLTALSGVARWKELSSFAPLTSSLTLSFFPILLLCYVRGFFVGRT